MDGKQPVIIVDKEQEEPSFRELAEKFEEIAKKLDEIAEKMKMMEPEQRPVCDANCCYHKKILVDNKRFTVTVCRYHFSIDEDAVDFLVYLLLKYRQKAEEAVRNYKNLKLCNQFTEDYDIAVFTDPPALATSDQLVYIFKYDVSDHYRPDEYVRIFINPVTGEIVDICKADDSWDEYYIEHYLKLALYLKPVFDIDNEEEGEDIEEDSSANIYFSSPRCVVRKE
jgi:hypothetical protein